MNATDADASTQTVEESLYEVRKKIYPRAVSGVFARARLALVLHTQILFYGAPWLQWNDRQAVLFDLVQRKFYILGLVLWPQDVIYLALLLILGALSLFLFTAVAGRLFCGYACPQTVYTEIFMWIERRVEGDRFARIRLDGEDWPWSLRKWRLKLTKHALWMSIALWTGFTFVGYFTPIRELGAGVVSATLGPWQTFWMCFYSFATWGNAGFMREQVCKYMCPYARFQSVMVDRDTFVVTYDKRRGEPRGSRAKAADYKGQGLGACVDCNICVQVCPTGIDIREGLQYMCIGCGACADGCDQVMEKMNYPKGLIRYTTERAIDEGLTEHRASQHLLRPRVLIYSGILLLLGAAFVVSLVMRNPLRVDVMRDRGALAREVAGGKLENVYRMQIMNASEHPMKIEVKVSGLPELQVLDGAGKPVAEFTVGPASNVLLPLKVRIPNDAASAGAHTIYFDIRGEEFGTQQPRLRDEKSSFIIPR